MTRHVLLSVRPRFARALLDGSKTVEVRRRFPTLAAGAQLLIYSSTPDRSVLGSVELRKVTQVRSNEVWDRYRTEIEIGETELNQYLTGRSEASIIEVGAPCGWEQPVSLEKLRLHLGVQPAQSYRYLNGAQARLLSEFGVSGS